jgi:hypothetical protein
MIDEKQLRFGDVLEWDSALGTNTKVMFISWTGKTDFEGALWEGVAMEEGGYVGQRRGIGAVARRGPLWSLAHDPR